MSEPWPIIKMKVLPALQFQTFALIILPACDNDYQIIL